MGRTAAEISNEEAVLLGELEQVANSSDIIKDASGTMDGLKFNRSASTAPGVSDDNTAGYAVGSEWIDTTADKAYKCLDASTGAAVWTETTSSGGGGGDPIPLIIAASDEVTDLTTGTAKVTFRMPYGFDLDEVRASLTDASTSGTPTIDINESGASILSTKITIDINEKTSTTAATPPVISDSTLADDAEITIDIDVAGTGAKGLKVYLIGTKI